VARTCGSSNDRLFGDWMFLYEPVLESKFLVGADTFFALDVLLIITQMMWYVKTLTLSIRDQVYKRMIM
jgi:hypothetical protein